MSRSGIPVPKRQTPYRFELFNLTHELNLNEHNHAFARDVCLTYPTIAEEYAQRFPKRTDLESMRKKASSGEYTFEIEHHFAQMKQRQRQKEQQNIHRQTKTAKGKAKGDSKSLLAAANQNNNNNVVNVDDDDEDENDDGEDEEVKNKRELEKRIKNCISSFRDDCQLVRDNCVEYNKVGLPLFVEYADQFLKLATQKLDALQKKWLADPPTTSFDQTLLLQNHHHHAPTATATPTRAGSTASTMSDASSSFANVTGGGGVAGKAKGSRRQREGVQQQQQQQDDDNQHQQHQQHRQPNNRNQHQNQASATSEKFFEPLPAMNLGDPAALHKALKEKYKNHESVSGPLALNIPACVRERIISQHVSYSSRCTSVGLSSSSYSSLGSFGGNTTASSLIPSAKHSEDEKASNGITPKLCPQQDLVVTVLAEFFESYCMQQQAQIPLLQKVLHNHEFFKKSSLKDLIKKALCRKDRDEISSPFALLLSTSPSSSSSSVSSASSSSASSSVVVHVPRCVEHYWGVLTRVVIPWFDESAIKKPYVYVDERANAMIAAVLELHNNNNNNNNSNNNNDQQQQQQQQQQQDQDQQQQEWHKLLHYDVLTRSLLDLPIVAGTVLCDSMLRFSEGTLNVQLGTSSSALSVKEEDIKASAVSLVSTSIVPVINDLLEFIGKKIQS